MITAICQECDKQFEYDLKPGFPRKYCLECSAIKKAQFAEKQPDEKVEVVKPGEQVNRAIKGQHTTMYTSYAKDVFNHICCTEAMNTNEKMQEAIELVKQAKAAFE